jgi:glycosyltransferase involved in cell wall biosynthesis
VSKPTITVVRGHQANLMELRAWEFLRDDFDVTVLATPRGLAGLEGLDLPKRVVATRRDLLPRGRVADMAVHLPGDGYRDLERALAGSDVVHSAELGPWLSAQPARLKARLGFRLVLTYWETIPFHHAYRTRRAGANRDETLPATDLFLPTTERAAACLRLEGVDEDRIRVCPPGIDTRRFAIARTADPSAPQVLSPGRLVWEKGHQDAIRAVAALKRGNVPGVSPLPTPVRLVIVGQGPDGARLRRYAADLGVSDLVDFRDHVPYAEMPGLFARSACMVLASLPLWHWEEQFGLVLAEAMAGDTPIVAARSGAIPEVVGDAGRYFDPGDWLGLAQVLAAGPLATPPDNPAPRPDLVERYSSEAYAERIAAAYRAVLGA